MNHFNFKNIVFCSAIQTEIDGLDFRIANKLSLGVGNIDASIRLTEYLTHNPNIQEIIFLGSAGSYNPTISQVGDISFGKNYYYKEISTWKGESKSPILFVNLVQPNRGELGNYLFHKMLFKEFDVNSPNSVTNIQIKDLPFWENSPLLENMEVFGLSRVANLLNRKFSSILGITNQVNERGSEEWKRNYKDVAKKQIDILNFSLSSIREI